MTKVFGQHAGQPRDLFATICADRKILQQVSAQEIVSGKAQPAVMLQTARLTTDPDSILDGIELVVLDKPVYVRESAVNGQLATTTGVCFMVATFGAADLEEAAAKLVADIGVKFENVPVLLEEITEVGVYLNRVGYDLAEQNDRTDRFTNFTEAQIFRVLTGQRQFAGMDESPLVVSELSDMVDTYPRNAISFKAQDTEREVRVFVENAGLNFIDQTAYNAIPEAKFYFLDSSDHHVGESGYTTIAQNAGYPLYLYATDIEHLDHPDTVVLTREEAAVVSTGRIFNDVTSLGVIAQARAMQPYILADRAVLNKIQAAVAGYYHAQDLDLATIQSKLAFWQDALNAVTAGSVELTVAALEGMSAAGPGTNYQEVYLNRGSVNWNGIDYNWIYYTPWNLGIAGAVSDSFFWVGKQRPSWWTGADQFFVRLKTSQFAAIAAEYTTVKFTAQSGTTLSLNIADAVTDPSEPNYYYWGFQAQAGVTDDVEAQAITNEIGANSALISDTYWVLSFSNATGTADNELVELSLNDLNQHLAKFPR